MGDHQAKGEMGLGGGEIDVETRGSSRAERFLRLSDSHHRLEGDVSGFDHEEFITG